MLHHLDKWIEPRKVSNCKNLNRQQCAIIYHVMSVWDDITDSLFFSTAASMDNVRRRCKFHCKKQMFWYLPSNGINNDTHAIQVIMMSRKRRSYICIAGRPHWGFPSLAIGCYNDRIALIFDRHFDSTATGACQIPERLDKYKSESRGIDTSRDLLR